MTDVLDLAEYRARRVADAGLPAREPDLTVHAWLSDGQIDLTSSRFGAVEALSTHGERVAALNDVAWSYGVDSEVPRDEQPAVWWLLDKGGRSLLIHDQTLYEGADWRHALWVIQCWWHATRRVVRIAWQMCRGRR